MNINSEQDINNQAYFYCVISVYNPVSSHIENFSGKLEGNIRFPPSNKINSGFGL